MVLLRGSMVDGWKRTRRTNQLSAPEHGAHCMWLLQKISHKVLLEKAKKGLLCTLCSDEVGASGKTFDINCEHWELTDDLIQHIQKAFDDTKQAATKRSQHMESMRKDNICSFSGSKIGKLKPKVRSTPDLDVQQQIAECFWQLTNHVEYNEQCKGKNLESHNGIDINKDDGRVKIWKFFFQSVAGLCLLASSFTDAILKSEGCYALKIKLTSTNVVLAMLVAACNIWSILWWTTKYLGAISCHHAWGSTFMMSCAVRENN